MSVSFSSIFCFHKTDYPIVKKTYLQNILVLNKSFDLRGLLDGFGLLLIFPSFINHYSSF